MNLNARSAGARTRFSWPPMRPTWWPVATAGAETSNGFFLPMRLSNPRDPIPPTPLTGAAARKGLPLLVLGREAAAEGPHRAALGRSRGAAEQSIRHEKGDSTTKDTKDTKKGVFDRRNAFILL